MMGMRVYVLLLIFWSSSVFVYAQDTVPQKGPYFTFDVVEYDFGEIYSGDSISYTFPFTNTGNEELLLFNVQTTCGCTAPSWPKEAIAPGEKSEIRIVFNSTGKTGSQRKPITIISNAVNNPTPTLVLRGKVLKVSKTPKN